MTHSESKDIVGVKFTGIEKRYKPTKHYVYIMQVSLSDSSEYTIYRKYGDFFKLSESLTEVFPEESRNSQLKGRIIPDLPGRNKESRKIRKSALKGKFFLEEYCKKLLNLDPRISRHDYVIAFFRQRESDKAPSADERTKPKRSLLMAALALISPGKHKKRHSSTESLDISAPVVTARYRAVADHKGLCKGEVSFKEDDIIEIIEKNNDGWWLVQTESEQGWAPASYLHPLDNDEEPEEPAPLFNYEQYLAVQDYTAVLPDEVTFKKGAIISVMHKILDGWWIVQLNGQVGYAPATYMIPYAPRVPGQMGNSKDSIQVDIMAVVSDILNKKRLMRPSQRRCTIKSKKRSASGNLSGTRDLTMYKKMSIKLNKKQAEKPHVQMEREYNDTFEMKPTDGSSTSEITKT